MAIKHPYFKHEFKTSMSAMREWKFFDGAQGCTRLDLEGVHLRMDRAPLSAALVTKSPQGPLLAEAGKEIMGWFKSAPATPPTPKPAQEPKRPLLVEAWKEIQGWGKAQADDKGGPSVPPFDIQDIPGAMDRIKWPKSADHMRQFFAGGLNYSRSSDDERDAINQNNEYYAREFVETKRFTWKWLLDYAAVERAYQKLIAPGYIDSAKMNALGESAQSTMKRKLAAHVLGKSPYFMGQIDTLEECAGDVFALHRQFQFQTTPLSMGSFINTDLGGSLGNFSLYAAVARANVHRADFQRTTVTITHVYVYAKDNYSFTDEPGKPSQYLGHWNKTGVIYVPLPSAIQLFQGALGGHLPEVNAPYNTFLEGVEFAVLLGDKLNEEHTFYPVRNRDFWNWQHVPRKNPRGGNVLSFSDLKLIALPAPIVAYV